jgi:hypothetical protein
MKLTVKQLRSIIREEVKRTILTENDTMNEDEKKAFLKNMVATIEDYHKDLDRVPQEYRKNLEQVETYAKKAQEKHGIENLRNEFKKQLRMWSERFGPDQFEKVNKFVEIGAARWDFVGPDDPKQQELFMKKVFLQEPFWKSYTEGRNTILGAIR